MKPSARWWAKLLAGLLALALSGVFLLAGPLAGDARADLGVLDSPKITKLIYPTLGNPALVPSGGRLTLEFDPREQDWGRGFIALDAFEIKVDTSNGPHPVTLALPVESFRVGYSERWPEYVETDDQDRRLYLVTVAVPRDVPIDLYDVSVRARGREGKWLEDAQPHAFQAIDSFKDRFSFCQLTDIHVWGPECYYPTCTYHERSQRPNGTDPNRKGAVYYRKAIDQVNLMKPDFCVFSGDYMFGQAYFEQDQGKPWGVTTEYEYEMLWFYEETMRLDVPVFMAIGNHDGYNEGGKGAGEDWFDNWRKLFGPLYHSFDYGDCHFLSLNSMDWAPEDRILQEIPDVALMPTKYKGQFRGGGDPWRSGFSPVRLKDLLTSDFTGQLAWIKDDLEKHMDAKIRVCVMHHDPWREKGHGEMWASSVEGGKSFLETVVQTAKHLLNMGDGRGRLAIIKLMRDYNVALEVSGHKHDDYVAVKVVPWKDGTGEIKFVNTTSTQFQTDEVAEKYPGYRRIWISDGRVESFNYKEPDWSYPWYEGTNVGGKTDLGKLTDPAVTSSFNPRPGDAEEVACAIDNRLEKPLERAYAEFPMPYLSDGYYYVVENGEFGDVYDVYDKGPGQRVYQVYTGVAPAHVKTVVVKKSAAPDGEAPAGTLRINNGAATTGSAAVTLNITAGDTGGSGLKDIMISNTPDFSGAVWERFRDTVPWNVSSGSAGPRTVYARFRDGAMPPNVSGVTQATVTCERDLGTGWPARTWYFAAKGDAPGHGRWLSLRSACGEEFPVDVIYTLPNGESRTEPFVIPPVSTLTINSCEMVGGDEFQSVEIRSPLPVVAGLR